MLYVSIRGVCVHGVCVGGESTMVTCLGVCGGCERECEMGAEMRRDLDFSESPNPRESNTPGFPHRPPCLACFTKHTVTLTYLYIERSM